MQLIKDGSMLHKMIAFQFPPVRLLRKMNAKIMKYIFPKANIN